MPKKLYQKLKLTDFRIYSKIANLWTLTNYSGGDPEVSNYDTAHTPRSIDFTFGLAFGF
jgi:hypothetical protein